MILELLDFSMTWPSLPGINGATLSRYPGSLNFCLGSYCFLPHTSNKAGPRGPPDCILRIRDQWPAFPTSVAQHCGVNIPKSPYHHLWNNSFQSLVILSVLWWGEGGEKCMTSFNQSLSSSFYARHPSTHCNTPWTIHPQVSICSTHILVGKTENRRIHSAEISELQTQYSGVVGRLHPTGDLPTVNTAFGIPLGRWTKYHCFHHHLALETHLATEILFPSLSPRMERLWGTYCVPGSACCPDHSTCLT